MAGPTVLDRQQMNQVAGQFGEGDVRNTNQINRRKEEVVMYYRKPERLISGERNREAGWIVWGFTQPGVLANYQERGFTLLRQFGRIWEGNPHFDEKHPLAIILAHPQGPAMFPVDQVMTYRWYDPANLPIVSDSQCPKCERIHRIRFPQLVGVDITEYPCPVCDRPFAKPIWLGRHLTNAHDYDRTDLAALGRETGINFSEKLTTMLERKTYTIEEVEAPEPEPVYQPVTVNRVVVPVAMGTAAKTVEVSAPVAETIQPDGTKGLFGRIWLGGKQVSKAAYEKAQEPVAA